jgi:hypothetical protein
VVASSNEVGFLVENGPKWSGAGEKPFQNGRPLDLSVEGLHDLGLHGFECFIVRP